MSKGRVSESIARRIKRAIFSGRLSPGHKLPAERDMAERLGASRVSVREAYRSLEEAGLIAIKRGAEGGAFIADFDHGPASRHVAFMLQLGRASHRELTEARLLLEPPLARLAAQRAAREDLAELAAVLRQQEKAVRAHADTRHFDVRFHRVVAQSAHNLPLAILLNSLADLAVETWPHAGPAAGGEEEDFASHARICEAIQKGDGEAAYRLMMRHVREVQARLGRGTAEAGETPPTRRGGRRRPSAPRRRPAAEPSRQA
jgi:GntR family transcriptional regulator, transcriptional repressor for pyruvate dehydrogenase complex